MMETHVVKVEEKQPFAERTYVRVRLERRHLDECRRFSDECSKSQQAIEFGQADTAARSFAEITRDNLIGKLGEFAVQRFLEENDIRVDLDLDIYERGEWDACDIQWRGWTFDVKCTKSRSHWFLVEWNKLQFRADAGELPHFFILTRLVDDRIVTDPSYSAEFVEVDLVGYVDTRRLAVGTPGVEVLSKGSMIPGTKTPLMAQSFGIEDRIMEHDWRRLIRTIGTESPFSLADYEAPGIILCDDVGIGETQEAPLHSHSRRGPRYSLLVSGDSLPSPEELADFSARGIKLYAFVPENKMGAYAHLQGRAASRIFSVQGHVPPLCLYDGVDAQSSLEALQRLAKTAPGFNLEQFFVEHASSDTDIVVKASAGTGKTTVMIDRIIFLFAMDDSLMPGDIGMITFTNKATASMTEKLQRRVQSLYELTRSSRWFSVLEGLADIQMSTIDSFFKSILSTEGGALGYGSGARLRSFVYEREKLLKNILNDLFKEKFALFSNARTLYNNECLDVAFEVWKKMRGRGFFQNDVQTADFGSSSDEASNRIIAELVRQGDRRYEELKHDLNAYAVDDLKAEVSALSDTEIQTLHRRPLRHIFVDEFQDTDNSQIRGLVWLRRIMNANIFVVGDVKQSIYRFRGAEESAFDELQKQLRRAKCVTAEEFVLVKNYRTAPKTIKKLNSFFGYAGAKRLLHWESDAVACIKGSGDVHIQKVSQNRREEGELGVLLHRLNEKHRHVCLLVRDNFQVERAVAICRSLNFRCHAKRRGGFYRTRAVLEFQALIEALLYPQDSRKLWNLLMTSYCARRPDPDVVAGFDGDQALVGRYLVGLLEEDGWGAMREGLRTSPFFAELNRILAHLNPVGHFKSELELGNLDKEDVEEELEHYMLNLNKLLSILYEKFSGEFPSIFDVCEYLRIKIATDREEDELYPEIKSRKGCVFEVMTVHKAKGLEFEAVILPFTNKPFFKDARSKKEKYVTIRESDSGVRVGWKMRNIENSIYREDADFERDAVVRDETRLLYVAMTRTKEDLYVLLPSRVKPNTWAELLVGANGALS